MASTMKGFYRQKKKDAGISKPSVAAAANKKKSPPLKAASDLAQQPYLSEHDDVLRQFDLNMAYGPCLGLTRLARWERAQRLGLNPPVDIESLLKAGKAQPECVWNGRV